MRRTRGGEKISPVTDSDRYTARRLLEGYKRFSREISLADIRPTDIVTCAWIMTETGDRSSNSPDADVESEEEIKM